MRLLLDSDVWILVGFALATWCLYRIQPEFAGIFVGVSLLAAGLCREFWPRKAPGKAVR
jgi:hypothetical protein